MKIKKINIISFGKLENLELSFKDSKNIIYGSNESGKTTIRAFIFAMLFGGTLPGTKRAIYSKDFEKYIPWSNPKFEGTMIIEYKGENYYLYRNFLKGKESFDLINLKTGRDSRNLFKIDSSRKVEKFDESFFKISESTLRDLFEITDEYYMEDNLSYDLKDRIINHFNTESEDLSVSNIIDKIQDYSFNKDLKKELQILNNKYLAIENELKYLNSSVDYDSTFAEIKNINEEIDSLKNKLEGYEEDLNRELMGIESQYIARTNYSDLLQEKIRIENEISTKEDILKKLNFVRFLDVLILLLLLLIAAVFLNFVTRELLNKFIYISLGSIFLRFFLTFLKRINDKEIKSELRELYSMLDQVLEELKFYYNEDNRTTSKDLIIEINRLKDRIQEKAIERERIFERIKILDLDLNKGIGLREKNKNYKKRIENINFKKEMGLKAIEIINELSKVKFENASSSLLEDCSEFLSIITKGKYIRLLISDTSTIYLYDSVLQKIVNIDDLSKGTVGQVYLAYRLGLIVNSGLDFPIIIDDGFTLFDMERNRSSLNLLEKISESFQVIYLTSNIRDVDILKNNINVNLIELG